MTVTIENLREITMEQIKVILDLVTKLREVVFENIFTEIKKL